MYKKSRSWLIIHWCSSEYKKMDEFIQLWFINNGKNVNIRKCINEKAVAILIDVEN